LCFAYFDFFSLVSFFYFLVLSYRICLSKKESYYICPKKKDIEFTIGTITLKAIVQVFLLQPHWKSGSHGCCLLVFCRVWCEGEGEVMGP
jgi:hypothetical protein